MEIIVKAWLNGELTTAGKLRWSGRRVEFWYHGAGIPEQWIEATAWAIRGDTDV